MKKLMVGINAKFIHSNLGIRYIQKYGRKYGMVIDYAEYTINQSMDYILDEIVQQSADVICFSCYLWNIDYVRKISRMLKKVVQEVTIVLGGPEVSYNSQWWLENEASIDYVISGEGEEATLRLFEALEGSGTVKPISSLFGITYREKEQVVKAKQGKPMSMADIPFPYEEDMSELDNRIIYYETSRGCPYSCEYCLSSIEKGVRLRPLEMVFEELQFFLDKKVMQVKFVDRTFNAKRSHAMAIWQYLKEHDNGHTNFHFELTADLIDDEMIDFLKTLRVGLVQFEVGVQSTNKTTIVDINRKVDFERLKEVVIKIKEGNNIHLHLDLIAGLPREDYASFAHSFNDVMAIKPEQLQLGFLKVLKGSMMHKKHRDYGIVYREHAPYEVLSTNSMSYKELRRLKNIEEILELYYNSGQFIESVIYMMMNHNNDFEFFEGLADHWFKQGYFHVKHNRIKLFDYIYEYGVGCLNVDNDFLASLLLHDLSSKEKPKKWPSFATNQETVIDRARPVYQSLYEEGYFKRYKGISVRQIKRSTHMQVYDYDMVLWQRERVVESLVTPCYILYCYDEKDAMNGVCRWEKVRI